MNDPNGLFRASDGVWNAYFQHDPDTDVHGVMHWGHATSTDLLTWTPHPIVLRPDRLGAVFSGSAVIDMADTAGFGVGSVIAVYTNHASKEPGGEVQSLAVSHDDGMTFVPYEHNPVLVDPTLADFRDPKVLMAPDGWWVMVLAAGLEVRIYRSSNLVEWHHASTIAFDPAWQLLECPDLIQIDADPDRRWLLIVGVYGQDPVKHSATIGLVGRFDGSTFTPTTEEQVVDAGPDFYAAQTFFNAGYRPVMMAWMNSWRYALDHPAAGWRGMMTLPRTITLDADDRVVHAFAPLLPQPAQQLGGQRLTTDRAIVADLGDQARLDIETADGEPVATVTTDADGVSLQRYGWGDCGDAFAAAYAQTYSVTASGGTRVVVDHGTIELIRGGASISALAFGGPGWTATADGDVTVSLL